MSHHPFAVSLNPDIQVKSTKDHYTLHSAESDATALLTLATTPGIGIALDRLKAGNTTTEALVQGLAELDGQAAGEQFALTLQKLDEQGCLYYAVLPLAVAISLVETAELNPSESDWVHSSVGLVRSASLRPLAGVMVLESPDSQFQVKLLDWRANALLAQLAEPKPLAKLTPPPNMGPETAYQFLNLLQATGFLTTGHEPSSLVASGSDESMGTFATDASGEAEEVGTQLNKVDEALTATHLVDTEIPGNEAETTSVDVDASTPTTETLAFPSNTPVQAEEATTENPELEASEDRPIEVTETDGSDGQRELDAETEQVVLAASTQLTNDVEVESSAAKIGVALHPHDLDDSLPGLADLRNQTLGDPCITIVILDGNPDHTLSCFEGAKVSKVFPYWQETLEPIPQEDYATYREIDARDIDGHEKAKAMEAAIPESNLIRIHGDNHACHITSMIVGQEHTPAPGLAPDCRVINIPINSVNSMEELISPLNLARAFDLALDLGANIIHCALCRPTQTGEGEELLTQAVKKCQDNNILIVAPAGNEQGKCLCLPAALPGALAVGAMKADSTPYHFSNWGGNYTKEGIMAPGGDILGAQPGTDEPIRKKGTSVAAPVMTGIAALLMSLQLQEGKPIDAEAVRIALLNTAIPCDPNVVADPERCLRGFVNIPGAMRALFGQPSVTISFAGDQVTRTERAGYAISTATVAPASIIGAMATDTSPAVQPATPATPTEASVTAADSATVEASTAYSGNVYALGTLGYDFGDESRRDTFKQLMAPSEINGIMVPADPYDARQMVEYLDRNPNEAHSLIWTLSLDGDTIYVLEPTGAFSAEIYEMFLLMLAGQLEAETSDEFVERISVPARRTNRTVELFSGEVVPVVKVHDVRGMYGWKVNALVNAAMVRISRQLDEAQEPLVRQALTSFLNRVYNDLRNLGQTSRDRALNFAATNIFQAAVTFARAIVQSRQLDTITVEKSPFCRLNSDCWDVKLEFFDPESSSRSRKVFRFTLDVVQPMPVTLGEVRSWSIPGKGSGTQR
ncbi:MULTISPECIES: PatA/PatG family cyanobactin maturation protease [unclassified Microcoleus]|uniref:PatA/PatG family cyanobactin maturation protease n=1 Tax=unclassified Microcoleus TaxID=2642155 RepID=UPI0025DA1259|nr:MULTISPECIES: PatA/PatG family cyanobactin maturation protease [unclassified Microcoleus]